MKRKIIISPSLICADLCNLEKEVKDLSLAGMKSLHVDLIDPHFSPSMPIGIDIVKQLKAKSNMDFDVHIMSNYNEFFIKELVKMDISSITFHSEATIHVEKMLQIIKEAGIKAGIALAPATSLSTIEYVAKACDYILLMTINPGYAGGKSEEMVPYAIDKIRDGKAQGFDIWFKEFIFNLIIQPFHLLMYFVLVGMAVDLANSNILYSIVAIGFMIPAEKLLRKSLS